MKKNLEESAQTQCKKHFEVSEFFLIYKNKSNHKTAQAVLRVILQHKSSHIPENGKVKTSKQEKKHNYRRLAMPSNLI